MLGGHVEEWHIPPLQHYKAAFWTKKVTKTAWCQDILYIFAGVHVYRVYILPTHLSCV